MEEDSAAAKYICNIELPGGVSIRPYSLKDVSSISRHGSSKNVAANLRNRFPHPYTEDDAKFWIDLCSKPDSMTRAGKWTAEGGSEGPLIPTNYTVSLNGEAVGSIGADFGKDVAFRTAEIGYWLGEENWGKGIMSKVVPAFVQWVWATFDILVRLNGEVWERNGNSALLLKKAGFEYEGRRPSAAYKNGRNEDVLIFGMLRPNS